jgi:hypothetical protein
MDGYAGHPVLKDSADVSLFYSSQQNPSPMKKMGF